MSGQELQDLMISEGLDSVILSLNSIEHPGEILGYITTVPGSVIFFGTAETRESATAAIREALHAA